MNNSKMIKYYLEIMKSFILENVFIESLLRNHFEFRNSVHILNSFIFEKNAPQIFLTD